MAEACELKKVIILNSPKCDVCGTRASLKSKGGPCYACTRAREGAPLFCEAGQGQDRSGLWDYQSSGDDEPEDCDEEDIDNWIDGDSEGMEF